MQGNGGAIYSNHSSVILKTPCKVPAHICSVLNLVKRHHNRENCYKLDRYMLELPKIIIISKFYQWHAKISTPTGATAPVEKVEEISSIN